MRKNGILKLILGITVVFGVIVLLNIEVTTRQGFNYRINTLRLPLYLKVLDFFDRHYNYKLTVERIIGKSIAEEEKILKIFVWTYTHIKKTPDGLPVVDDHVWHTIIRGYGVNDQFSDVFTTLCNYVGAEAFFSWIKGKNPGQEIPLSFVELHKRLYVFDPYNGVYFKNNKKKLADIEDIKKGDWLIESLDSPGKPGIDYTHYFKNIYQVDRLELTRSNTQSPLNRLKFEIKKCLRLESQSMRLL